LADFFDFANQTAVFVFELRDFACDLGQLAFQLATLLSVLADDVLELLGHGCDFELELFLETGQTLVPFGVFEEQQCVHFADGGFQLLLLSLQPADFLFQTLADVFGVADGVFGQLQRLSHGLQFCILFVERGLQSEQFFGLGLVSLIIDLCLFLFR